MKLFLSPHNDDETLFGALTIMRERPTVCVVFDSYVQPSRGIPGCDAETRRAETCAALRVLTEDRDAGWPVVAENFLGLRDDGPMTSVVIASYLVEAYRHLNIEQVWAPAFEEGGHDQHNLVAQAADPAFPGKVKHYLTYTRPGGKSRHGYEVMPRSGDDIARKLRALACYTSQLQIDPRLGCWPHFMRDLSEYVL